MKQAVAQFIKEHKIKIAVSGGAAWADHLAVRLYNANLVSDLQLYLPTEFLLEECKFQEGSSWKSAGNIANYYHHKFSQIVNINSLQDIGRAVIKGSVAMVGNGFIARNSLVAQEANILLAFTFGNGRIVKDGGTADTVKKFIKINGNENAYHCDLNDMQVYQNAEAL